MENLGTAIFLSLTFVSSKTKNDETNENTNKEKCSS